MKNPYMPLWVVDYQQGTKFFTHEEKGFYMDILIELWIDGELPNNPKILSKHFNQDIRTFNRLWSKVEHKFLISNGKVSHKRVKLEREKMIEKSEKARDAGKKGGNAKAQNLADATNPLEPKASHTDTDTYTDKEKKNKKKKNDDDEAIEIINYYKTNLKNAGWQDGLKSLQKLHKTGISYSDLFQYVKNYEIYIKNKKDHDSQFTIQANNFFGNKASYKEYTESATGREDLSESSVSDTRPKGPTGLPIKHPDWDKKGLWETPEIFEARKQAFITEAKRVGRHPSELD